MIVRSRIIFSGAFIPVFSSLATDISPRKGVAGAKEQSTET